MYKKIIIFVLSHSLPLFAGPIFSRNQGPINPANHAGGVFSDNVKKTSDNALTIMTKVENLAKDPENAESMSYHTTKGAVEGLGAAIATGAAVSKDAVVAKAVAAKVAATGALASPAAPFFIGWAALAGVGFYWVHQNAMRVQAEKIDDYKKCLNTSLMKKTSSEEEINHDDIPYACKPSEKAINAWFGNKEKTQSIKAKYHKLKKNGGNFRQSYK